MFNEINNLGLFVAAGLLLNLTPGPDVLYIMTHSLKGGWRPGAVAALGITAGCFVHVAAAALGLSALMAASGTAFATLKWLGGAYLVYVGWAMLAIGSARHPENAPDLVACNAASTGSEGRYYLRKVLLKGFWTSVLNPKVALFFLAFLPQFIAPGAEHQTATFLLLGLIFNFNSLWINLGYAAIGSALLRRFAALQRAMHWLERAAGALFIGLGLKLALTDNPTH